MLADRVIFVCALVLAAVYFYATAQIPTLEIGDPLGPKAFPRLIGIGMLIAAGMLLMEMLHYARAKKAKDPQPVRKPAGDLRHLWVIAAVTVWTALYMAVFEWLGYVVATSIYLLALMAYFHPGKWMTNILTALLFCAGSYYMFNHMLGVNLARGILPF
jgi:putative tricarboxylic transport membrane protein